MSTVSIYIIRNNYSRHVLQYYIIRNYCFTYIMSFLFVARISSFDKMMTISIHVEYIAQKGRNKH